MEPNLYARPAPVLDRVMHPDAPVTLLHVVDVIVLLADPGNGISDGSERILLCGVTLVSRVISLVYREDELTPEALPGTSAEPDELPTAPLDFPTLRLELLNIRTP